MDEDALPDDWTLTEGVLVAVRRPNGVRTHLQSIAQRGYHLRREPSDCSIGEESHLEEPRNHLGPVVLATGLTEALIEPTLYGAFTVVFSAVIYLFSSNGRPAFFIFLALVLLFLSITAHLINSIYVLYFAFIYLGGGVPAAVFYLSLSSPVDISLVEVATFVTVSPLGSFIRPAPLSTLGDARHSLRPPVAFADPSRLRDRRAPSSDAPRPASASTRRACLCACGAALTRRSHPPTHLLTTTCTPVPARLLRCCRPPYATPPPLRYSAPVVHDHAAAVLPRGARAPRHPPPISPARLYAIPSLAFKVNALPEEAYVVVNHRLSADNSIPGRVFYQRYTVLLTPEAAKFNLSFGESPPAGVERYVQLSSPRGAEASPMTSAECAAWEVFSRTSTHLWPDAIVAPYLSTCGTDTRSYVNLTRAIFRFQGVHDDER
ncbi:hypothetical protein FB451DRAFT_1572630, partial [Mycena latifolia]